MYARFSWSPSLWWDEKRSLPSSKGAAFSILNAMYSSAVIWCVAAKSAAFEREFFALASARRTLRSSRACLRVPLFCCSAASRSPSRAARSSKASRGSGASPATFRFRLYLCHSLR